MDSESGREPASTLQLCDILRSSRASTAYFFTGLLMLVVGTIITADGFRNIRSQNPIFIAGPVMLGGAVLCFSKAVLHRLAQARESQEQLQQEDAEDAAPIRRLETDIRSFEQLRGEEGTTRLALLDNMEVQMMTFPNGQLAAIITSRRLPTASSVPSDQTCYPIRAPPYTPRDSIPAYDGSSSGQSWNTDVTPPVYLPPYGNENLPQEEAPPYTPRDSDCPGSDLSQLPAYSTLPRDTAVSGLPPYSVTDPYKQSECSPDPYPCTEPTLDPGRVTDPAPDPCRDSNDSPSDPSNVIDPVPSPCIIRDELDPSRNVDPPPDPNGSVDPLPDPADLPPYSPVDPRNETTASVDDTFLYTATIINCSPSATQTRSGPRSAESQSGASSCITDSLPSTRENTPDVA